MKDFEDDIVPGTESETELFPRETPQRHQSEETASTTRADEPANPKSLYDMEGPQGMPTTSAVFQTPRAESWPPGQLPFLVINGFHSGRSISLPVKLSVSAYMGYTCL